MALDLSNIPLPTLKYEISIEQKSILRVCGYALITGLTLIIVNVIVKRIFRKNTNE
jgi:hypothetical protein